MPFNSSYIFAKEGANTQNGLSFRRNQSTPKGSKFFAVTIDPIKEDDKFNLVSSPIESVYGLLQSL